MKHLKKIVFAGAGHAHLYSLKHAQRLIGEGAEVTVIGPDKYHYYSGMGPGLLSGIYTPEEVRIDIQRLIQKNGGKFIKSRVTGIDPDKHQLIIDTGERIDYDIASLNLGSHVPASGIRQAGAESLPVKPISNLEILRRSIVSMTGASVLRVLVIGTGPTGVEIAGNIWRIAKQRGGKSEISLTGVRKSLLPQLPLKANLYAMNSLAERNIHIHTNCRISSLKNGLARSKDGHEIPYEICVLATGTAPNRIYYGSGIETNGDGALVVNSYLQSRSHPNIFGGGDCIAFSGRLLDKVGVHAVRQAPIIFHNILAHMKGKDLKEFIPQKRHLQILNLGDQSGIFVYRPFVWKARWAFSLKNLIDKRFVAQFQS